MKRSLSASSRTRVGVVGFVVSLGSLFLGPGWVIAQLPAVRLLSLSPPGGQRGTTFEITLGGVDLDEAEKLHFSNPGLSAVPKVLPPAFFLSKPRAVPGVFLVTIAPETREGVYEVRASGRFGFSNPRAFMVSSLEEAAEKEPNNAPAEANAVGLESTVSGVVNGGADIDCFRFAAAKGQRVLVDCWAYRIDSRLDATLVLSDAAGSELDRSRRSERRDPLLDFTAETDGEYVVRIYDLQYRGGSEYFYRLSVGTFPRIDAIFPPAGLPGTRGRFTIYGRNLPGGQPAGNMLVGGKPLDALEVEIQLPWEPPFRDLLPGELVEASEAVLDGVTYQLETPAGASNPVLVSFAAAPVRREREPNDTPPQVQVVSLPCEVAGQFYPREDQDWVAFEARKGDIWWIEVFSHRLGLACDPYLLVQQVTLDSQGKEQVKDLNGADDLGGNIGGANFNTGTEDPAFRLVVPEDGKYRVLVRDLYSTTQADPRQVYRLAIRHESPDFRLVALPRFQGEDPKTLSVWSVLLRRGGTELVDVLTLRRDGFDEEIAVEVEGLPSGVACGGAVIGRGTSVVTLVFDVAEEAADWTGFVKVVGRARIGVGEVARRARSGALVWPGQENVHAPRSRLTSDLALAVSGSEVAPFRVELGDVAGGKDGAGGRDGRDGRDGLGRKDWEMARGGKLEVPVRVVRRGDFKGDVTLSPVGLPANVEAPDVTIKGDAADGKLELKVKNNAPVGRYTLHVRALAEVNYSRNPQAAARAAAWKQEIDRIAGEVKAAADKANEEKAAAEKLMAEKSQLASKAAEARDGAAKQASEAQAALKQAMEKMAIARDAYEKNTEDAGLLPAKTEAEKAAQAMEVKAKEAAEAGALAEKAAEAALAEEKATAAVKAAAEKAAAELGEKLKAAAGEQAEAAKRAEEAAKAANPAKLKAIFPSIPVNLVIVDAPLVLNLPGGATSAIKRGGKLEVVVSVERRFGFAEAVALSVVLPPSLTGVKTANVELPKDQSEAKLVFEAAADAVLGKHAVTIKAQAKYSNEDRVVTRSVVLRVLRASP